MAKKTVDFTAIRRALATVVSQATGLTTIMEMSDAERPPLPYVWIDFITAQIAHGSDEITYKEGNTYEIKGQRSFTASFNIVYGFREDAKCQEMSCLLHASLRDPVRLEYLRGQGLAVWEIGNLTDISQALETGFENRYNFDVTFGVVSTLESDLGYISSTEITGKVNDVTGSISHELNLDIDTST